VSANVMNAERAAKIAAKRIGVLVDEYQERRARGEKWCGPCGRWLARDSFGTDRARSDGLASRCADCARDYQRRYWHSNRCADCGTESVGQRCAPCFQARAERRAHDRAAAAPYRRLVWAIYTAARLERRANASWRRAARRFLGGLAMLSKRLLAEQRRHVAVAARLEALARKRAAREQLRLEQREALARKRAARRARWTQRKRREAQTPWSLDKQQFDGEGPPLGDFITRVEDDTAYIYEHAELAHRLREIVGDIGPEDVQRMDAWTLERLQARLLAEGITPSRPQESERERLKTPERHSGERHTKAPLIPGKKKRREKVAHKAANRARGNSNRPSQKPRTERRRLRQEQQRLRDAA
jgi:hypothetical protein